MKLHAVNADSQTDIQIRDEGGRVFAELDGRAYELEAHESSDGFLLITGALVFDCRVEGRPESGKPVGVVVAATRHELTLTDPKRLGSAATKSAHGDGAARIVAPMPGKVVRVMVAAGDKITAGDGIVVVEAMKMQNELIAPKAGIVIALNIQPGATVNAGDVLAVIE